jgi:FixJ family two-component response regulator
LKVVLISGYPVDPSTLVAGRMFFLQKPFSRENILEALAAAGG